MASINVFIRLDIVYLVLIGLLILDGIANISAQTNESLQYHYLCPKNFINVGKKCYHFSNTNGTWFQAYFNCRDLAKSNFTVFTDRYDQRKLEQFLFRSRNKTQKFTRNSFWVGGFKDWKQKKWIYTDGSLMQYPTKKDILMNEDQDNWTCLLIDSNSKRWKAEDCMEKRPFICETKAAIASVVLKVTNKKIKQKMTIDECISNSEILTKNQKQICLKLLDGVEHGQDRLNEPPAVIQQVKPAYSNRPTVMRAISHICPQNWMSLGNQCYLFSKEKVTWTDAHFNCGQINSKLTMIKSKVQDQKLRIFLNGFTEKQERWIGGRYNSKTKQWIWALNGKALKYDGFIKESFSNGTDGLEWQAIVMDPEHAYRWTHRNEMEKHLYICQVKGRAVKRLNYPKRPSATIEIISDRRNQRRNQQNIQFRNNRTTRRAGRNKRT